MNVKNLVFSIMMGIILSSCASTATVRYFQDVESGAKNQLVEPKYITVQPEDKISILVKSRDPLLTNLFNLPIVETRIGTTYDYSRGEISGYSVDENGDIDFPVLGNIKVSGLTRSQISKYIKNRLIEENLVKDPIVTVEFVNLKLSVLGEVTRPGRYDIYEDKVTILDALAFAGDLTIYGMRENVLVIRDIEGMQHMYQINLNNAKSMAESPAYYLMQNDVVYVEPNEVRARQSTVNGNNIRSTSFWISLASLLTSVSLIFVR